MGSGRIKIHMIGADIPATIDLLCKQGMVLYRIEYDGDLSASMEIPYGQYRDFKYIAERRGNEVRVRSVRGIGQLTKGILFRPVFITAVLLLIFLSVWVPSRVLFIAVEGNEKVPVTQILLQAEKSGVYFGASRRAVRSETVKNRLLESIPQLRWVGITTDGCTATIRVLEEETADGEQETVSYSNIIAVSDGVITSCTVTSGAAACSVGDAVKAGQVLISGYQDLGLLVKLTRAKGEVFAQTERTISLVTPSAYVKKESVTSEKVNYSLAFGKKRINLSKDSGISYAGCDKIYTTYYLTLPGGFVLPASLSIEQIIMHSQGDAASDEESLKQLLQEQSNLYLAESMVSGTSKNVSAIYNKSHGFAHMKAHYFCVEMIGREHQEEINIQYGKDD